MANHASSTESVAVVPEPINYGASFSSVINQFCADLNVNQEEVMHYTDLVSKTTTELQHPEYPQTSTTFVEVIIIIIHLLRIQDYSSNVRYSLLVTTHLYPTKY